MSPTTWVFTDAQYAGGAEHYLEWILEAAGPTRMGIVAMGHPGLAEWLERQRAGGFALEVLAPGDRITEWRRLRAWGARQRPQVLHVNLPGPYDGLLATAPRLAPRRTRVVVTEHLPGVGRVGKRYWWKRLWTRRVDLAIALCEAHAELLRSTFGYAAARVRVIPNGVRDAPDPLEPPVELRAGRDDVPRVVQVGSLIERKGGAEVIQALRGLHDRGVPADLWFVGEGPERSAWSALAARLDLASSVHFAGHQDNVAGFLDAADVVTLPSAREGMPLSLLEAMAHGRPVVASAVDGVPDLVEDGVTGRLIPPRDVPALTEALSQLLQDDSLRQRWGAAGRQRHRERFRLQTMLDATFAAYGWSGS